MRRLPTTGRSKAQLCARLLDAAAAAGEAAAPQPSAPPPRASRAAASRRGGADHGQDQGQDPWIGARRAPRVPLSPAPNAANQSSPAAAVSKLTDQGDAAAGRQTRSRRRITNAGALQELQHL